MHEVIVDLAALVGSQMTRPGVSQFDRHAASLRQPGRTWLSLGLMHLTETQMHFLVTNRAAAMITVGDDGRAKAVRVGVAVVAGKVWSSGTRDRVRTQRLRKDPRCTLLVFEPGFAALTLETTVEILDGPEVADQSVALFRTMQGKPDGQLTWYGEELEVEDFRRAMVDQGRIIYEFTIERAYGLD